MILVEVFPVWIRIDLTVGSSLRNPICILEINISYSGKKKTFISSVKFIKQKRLLLQFFFSKTNRNIILIKFGAGLTNQQSQASSSKKERLYLQKKMLRHLKSLKHSRNVNFI